MYFLHAAIVHHSSVFQFLLTRPSDLRSLSTPMTAVSVTFQVLTIITSVWMRVAPFPDSWRVYKAKRTGEVQTLPVVLLFTYWCVLLCYGYFSENILPLIVTSVLGLRTSVGLITFLSLHRQPAICAKTMCSSYRLCCTCVSVRHDIRQRHHQTVQGVNSNSHGRNFIRHVHWLVRISAWFVG